MRFHRLTVRDFKGIASPGPLEFPASGVLVVEGPNEAGKSSLMEAVDLLLDFKDSSSHRRVTDTHPIDRDEAPYVELEMSSGPYRFVYAKRWHRKGGSGARGRRGETTLRLLEPMTRQYSGTEAQSKADEIFDATLDRPLWNALRLMQATSLRPVALADSSALRSALDAAAGSGADAGGEGDSVVAAAEAAYRRYFTATTGRPTGDYERVLRALDEARIGDAEAREAVAQVERDVARHAAVLTAIEGLRGRLAEAVAKRDAMEAQRREGQRLRAQWADAERALHEARRAEREAAAAREQRDELVAEVVRRSEECERADARLAELTTCARSRGTAVAQASQAMDAAADAADQARTDVDAARTARQLRTVRAEHSRLVARLTRLDQLSDRLAQLRARVAASTVDEQVRAQVEAAERDLDRALVAQRAASARVMARGLVGDVRVSVGGDSVQLGHDEREWVLTEAMTVVVPGMVEVELIPEAGASDRAGEVEQARRRLGSLLRSIDVASPAEAYEQADARRVADSDRVRCEAERQAALDGDDLAALRDRERELARSLAEVVHPGTGEGSAPMGGDDESAFGDVTDEKLAELVAVEAAARGELARARVRFEQARASGEEARLRATGAEAETVAGRREFALREAALSTARASVSDAALDERHAQTQAVLALAVRERDAAAAEAEAAVGEEMYTAAERAADAAADRLRASETELVRIEAVLGEAGGQGRAERADAAASALESAERAEAAMTRRARAAKLLYETLRRHGDEAKAAYVAPFTAAVERLGRLVYGPTFQVVVGSDLAIFERILGGVSVPYASLSTGAKEQLAILVRLACAQLVDPAGGVPVVIDDALGYSDPDRILATTAAFEHVAEDAQVVMLTCTPGRYDGVRGATTVRVNREKQA